MKPNIRRSSIICNSIFIVLFLYTCTEKTIVDSDHPEITAINPDSGYVGSMISVSFEGILNPSGLETEYYFNGTRASLISSGSGSVVIVVPEGATSGPVSIRSNDQMIIGPEFKVLEIPEDTTENNEPVINSLDPTEGFPGDTVLISGSNLGGPDTVRIEMAPVNILSETNTQILFTVPDEAITGHIYIVYPDTMVKGPLFIVLTQIPAPVITSINPVSGYPGDTIEIYGSGFDDLEEVKLGNIPVNVFSNTNNVIRFGVPENGETANVLVSLKDTTMQGPVFTVLERLPEPPKIDFISPESGRADDIISIHGEFFGDSENDLKVTFNGTEAEFTLISDKLIEAEVPTKCGDGAVEVTKNDNLATGPFFDYLLTAYVTTLAGNLQSGFTDGDPSSARFNKPVRLAFDINGDILVADQFNHAIRALTTDGTVNTKAGTGIAGVTDGPGQSAQFNNPSGLAVDGSGYVYVADFSNHVIRVIDSKNNVSTVAGIYQAGYSEDKDPLNAQFNGPIDVTIGNPNTLYIADYNNNRIRRVQDIGTTTLNGIADPGFADGDPNTAKMNGPAGVFYRQNGTILFADLSNSAIRQIDLSGNITTLVGIAGAGDNDGDASLARLQNPYNAYLHTDGIIYIADALNHKIKILRPDNQVETLAGTGNSGWLDGKAESAEFNNPIDMIVDAQGNIYVADYNNNMIRKIYRE